MLLTFAAGHENTAKCLLYVLCKVMHGRLSKTIEDYATLCKIVQASGYDLIVFPFGFSLNLQMFSSYVKKSRLLANLTVLLTLSLKLKQVVSKSCFPSVR